MIQPKKYKICRRLGAGVYEKCQTAKFAASAANKKGKRSDKRPKPLSDFGAHLVEKQKVRFSYGVSEKQFSNYVKKATEKKGAAPTDSLFESLESRLDNVVYRTGLANTRALARQMVSHGHFMVNGKRTTVPSFAIRPGDVVSVREGSRSKGFFNGLDARLKTYTVPEWLTFDQSKMEAKVSQKPKHTEGFFNLNAVLEFYSR